MNWFHALRWWYVFARNARFAYKCDCGRLVCGQRANVPPLQVRDMVKMEFPFRCRKCGKEYQFMIMRTR